MQTCILLFCPAGTLFLPNGDIFQGEYAFDLKDGPGTFFYVSKNKRYDGVWSKDTGKCGLYGTIEQAGDDTDSGLPRLTLLEPMGVLEDEAYTLQNKREIEHSMVLGASGYDAPFTYARLPYVFTFKTAFFGVFGSSPVGKYFRTASDQCTLVHIPVE